MTPKLTAEEAAKRIEKTCDKIPWTAFTHGCLVSAISQACAEAREEALKEILTVSPEEADRMAWEERNEWIASGFLAGAEQMRWMAVKIASEWDGSKSSADKIRSLPLPSQTKDVVHEEKCND